MIVGSIRFRDPMTLFADCCVVFPNLAAETPRELIAFFIAAEPFSKPFVLRLAMTVIASPTYSPPLLTV